MNDFAKTFNTQYGQILITNDTRESEICVDAPSVNAFFMISKSFGVCEISIKFAKDDGDKCDEFFDTITEDKAVSMVEKTILSMR
tara:strand:- start:384 stop:638 length:255 start_codon:yes stop_codon:yes gene_type:complete